MLTPTIQDKHTNGRPRVWKGLADLNSNIEITFHLRHKHVKDYSEMTFQHPAQRQYLKHDDFKQAFEIDTQGVDLLKTFLANYELSITKAVPEESQVVVSGSLEALQKAFQVLFSIYASSDGQLHLGYEGQLHLPENLAPHIISISGLDKGLNRGSKSPVSPQEIHENAHKGYSPKDIEAAYNFPENDAEGECIGLIELGGDYKASDLKAYCKQFDIPVPEVVEVGTKPKVPANSQQLDNLEVSLDLQLAAGLAPKSKIVLYYASSIPDAIQLALNDAENQPSVLSVSWAISESDMAVADRERLDQLCYQAALKGITIVAASGDYGAYNNKSYLNVMLPAANPWVLGCGGTASYWSVDYQRVWNSGQGSGSGGGYSAIYPVPGFQQQAISQYKRYVFPYGNTGRGVPDVAANSAPDTPYSIVMNGKMLGIGSGTSASTPVWAALIARLNKKLGYRLGWLNELFYKLKDTPAFKSVVNGDNGFFPAAYGWNAATGLGTPNGVELARAISELEKHYPKKDQDQ